MIAAVFPGQGSQKPGMGKEFFGSSPRAQQIFASVAESTSQNISQLCFESNEETLRQTQNAQLALYTCGLAAWEAAAEANGKPLNVHAFAGHSVGEYAALAAAGVVGVSEGGRLVQRRGELMARAGKGRPGTMAAVLGLEKEILEQVCREASRPQCEVVIANDNCPGQLVISGDTAAVLKAQTLATEAGAKRVLALNVSGAFHSPLMEGAATSMGQILNPALFREGLSRVYSNVTADRVDGSTQWPELLEAQLRNPVRWTESIENMIRDGVSTFIEFGGGEVLCGLIRRTSKDVQTLAIYDDASLVKSLDMLREMEVSA